MSDPTTRTGSPKSGRGWETADKVAHGAGRALHGVALALVKGYAVVLLVGGVWMLVAGVSVWAGLALIAYGIYLITPGRKYVVW